MQQPVEPTLMRSKSNRIARARNRLRLQNCAMVAFAIGGCAQSAVPVATQHPTTNEPRQHVLVRFSNISLRPSVAQVVQGGTRRVDQFVEQSRWRGLVSAERRRPLYLW